MKNTQPSILLADDNADDQSFIRDAFSYIEANMHLRIVDSGKELLIRLHSLDDDELPSLIVLDYNMPELNGAEVLESLSGKERYEEIPKLILSTSVYQKHIDYCMSLGAIGYLIKPDNVFQWMQLARKMLEYSKK